MNNRLPILAAEIAVEHRAVVQAADEFVMHAIEAGKRLIEAKQLVGHGGWQDWLREFVPTVSIRTVQRYMRAASRADKYDTMSFSTLKEAIEDKVDHAEAAAQVAEIMAAWSQASAGAQGLFRDLVEIVGIEKEIPSHVIGIDPRSIRRTAATLRSLREPLP